MKKVGYRLLNKIERKKNNKKKENMTDERYKTEKENENIKQIKQTKIKKKH